MILIHCHECRRVVGKAEKLFERLGMTVLCGRCLDDLRPPAPEKDTITDFLRGLRAKRK